MPPVACCTAASLEQAPLRGAALPTACVWAWMTGCAARAAYVGRALVFLSAGFACGQSQRLRFGPAAASLLGLSPARGTGLQSCVLPTEEGTSTLVYERVSFRSLCLSTADTRRQVRP